MDPIAPGTPNPSQRDCQTTPVSSLSQGRRMSAKMPAMVLTREIVDLRDDPILAALPRGTHENREVPILGGIPLLAKLGQGGMGAVYYGIKPLLRTEVAVKILPSHMADSEENFVDRFLREAHLAASIESPHLVRVSDVNEDCGLFFLVMEYVDGDSAGTHLAAARTDDAIGLPETTVLELCLAASRGLAAAHARNVIHRDVKPDNIIVPKGPDLPLWSRAKLVDLGLARPEEPSSHSLTGTPMAMGTPGYMAPEQALDPRTAGKPSDVFSMGSTMYALLAGACPFRGKSITETMLMTIQHQHAPLKPLRPDLKDATLRLIDRCLAKNPADRPADGAALVQEIAECLERSSDPTGSKTIVINEVSLDSSTSRRRIRGQGANKGFHRRRLLAGGAGAFAVLLVAAIFAWPSPPAATPEVPAQSGLEIRVMSSGERLEWLRWASASFAQTPAGRNVQVTLIERSGSAAEDTALRADGKVHAWTPASTLVEDRFVKRFRETHHFDGIRSRRTLTLTPMVFVMFGDRHQAFIEKYGELSFSSLRKAMQLTPDWGSLAGRPEWGDFTFGITDPELHNSGLATRIILSASQSGITTFPALNETTITQTSAWLADFKPLIHPMVGSVNMIEEMVLKGPSFLDGAFIYESNAVAFLKAAEGRWGKVAVVYPAVNFWNESPYWCLNGARISDEERIAAEDFGAFLTGIEAQNKALEFGFRPGNPHVGILDPASPFVSLSTFGLSAAIPRVVQNPPPEWISFLADTSLTSLKTIKPEPSK